MSGTLNLTQLTTDVSNISKLSNLPTPKEMSGNDLKQIFDKGNNDIKSYINGTMIPELEGGVATREELQGLVLGQIPNGTITREKLGIDLSTELDNLYGVKNNVSKALLYPLLMSDEDLESAKLENDYGISQVASILSDIEELTKKYTELKYELIISGNATTGYIQNTNIFFSSLPQLVYSTGTVTFGNAGNSFTISSLRSTSGEAIYRIPNGGSKIKSLLCQYGVNDRGSTNFIMKVSYSTDGGETYTKITDVTSIDMIPLLNGHTVPDSNDNWQIKSAGDSTPPNLTEWTIDSTGNTIVTNIKFEVSNLYTGSSIYNHSGIFTFTPCVGNFDSDLGVVSKTGMWAGGTGSMAVEDSGVLTLSSALPKNTFVDIYVGVNKDFDTDEITTDAAKKMYLQASNDGTNWANLQVIRAARYYNSYYLSDGLGSYKFSLTSQYKYYRFYTDQTQSSTSVPCDVVKLFGVSYTKSENNVEIVSDEATSTQTIAKSFYVLEDDGNKMSYTVDILVNKGDNTYDTTRVASGTTPTNVTNTTSSKKCKFKITTSSPLIGSAKITSFLGAFI